MDFTYFKAAQIRMARPTDRMKEIIRFYEKGLGLKRVAAFQEHAGYDGVMYGLPGTEVHLEFTSHASGSPCPDPGRDQLLVFYIPDAVQLKEMADRLMEMGYPPVEPENPYWKEKGVTIEDPDKWRVVLMNTEGLI
ncbi:VOC family protein [Jeotgalibacillus haloalkalitolerans]|uniref:VOC family protein n=1 Tax=Jeotgalibacillus haloalkalitolerans TaxID=3104292 RepID=A0ABU5KN56_9BACL|nr:VOC family protein [Jeotgalibacillus sp. HH7-29]MDZ5712684.1 VOC family protein [Jeotgalibacillus sp. HH7-29]